MNQANRHIMQESSLEPILLGTAKKLLAHSSKLKALAIQQPCSYFALMLVEIVEHGQYTYHKSYLVRHAREDKPRTWRLDRLANILNEQGTAKLEVIFQQ
tara:strand:+ start:9555 stop:9854 length:300 start_codon:yes stop_codon:yes gene_type:complete